MTKGRKGRKGQKSADGDGFGGGISRQIGFVRFSVAYRRLPEGSGGQKSRYVADVLPICCRFAGVKLLIDNNVADVADFPTCNANSIELRSVRTAPA